MAELKPDFKIYLEGGGDKNKALAISLRNAMRTFLQRAGVTRLPRIVACGGRTEAYKDFRIALSQKTDAILLVDSEGPVQESSRWAYLKRRDGWEKPPGTTEEQCQLMVQQMESWFLADIEALATFYGREFHRKSLPPSQTPETVDRVRLIKGLEKASEKTNKGSYHKGNHQCEILERLEPNLVRQKCPHCEKLVQACLAKG